MRRLLAWVGPFCAEPDASMVSRVLSNLQHEMLVSEREQMEVKVNSRFRFEFPFALVCLVALGGSLVRIPVYCPGRSSLGAPRALCPAAVPGPPPPPTPSCPTEDPLHPFIHPNARKAGMRAVMFYTLIYPSSHRTL